MDYPIAGTGEVHTYEANCSAGKVPTGGGYSISNASLLLQVVANQPTPQGWAVTIRTPTLPMTLTVYVVCLNATT